jgi:hypothetical protein
MSTISASTTTTTAYKVTADTTGTLVLQTGSTPTTAVTIGTNQVATFAQAPVLPAASIPQAALASNVAGNGPAFSAYKSSNDQSMSLNTATKITFNIEEFDTNSNFASSAFTPTVAGYYQLNTLVTLGNGGTASGGMNFWVGIYRNGAFFKSGWNGNAGGSNDQGIGASALVYANGSTDYFEVYAWCSKNINVNGQVFATYFQGALVRAA